MTLNEAIEHARDVARTGCTECNREHGQLAEWLEELVERRAQQTKHGKWLSFTGTHWTRKENEYGDPEYKEHTFYVCSICRRKTVVRENFCPTCGAKMTGGDAE